MALGSIAVDRRAPKESPTHEFPEFKCAGLMPCYV